MDNLTIKEVEILDLLEANGIKILRPIHINIPLTSNINRKNVKPGETSSNPNSSSPTKKRSPFHLFSIGKKNNNNNHNNNN